MARQSLNTRGLRPIVLETPKSGMDMLFEEISKYASPEYQLATREQERADALLGLKQKEQLESSNLRKEQLELTRSQERRTQASFMQAKKDRDNQKLKDEFSMIYPTELTPEGLDNAESYANMHLSKSDSYPIFMNKIKQDRSVLQSQNEKIDALGSSITTIDPEFVYDSSNESHRELIKNQGDFILKNALAQGLFGEVPQDMRMQFESDKEGLSDITKFALEQIKPEERDFALKTTLGPAYTQFLSKYSDYNFSQPSIEGLLSGVGYDFEPMVDPFEGGINKIPLNEERGEISTTGQPDYISLVNQGKLEPDKIIDEFSKEGDLGFLETAADPGSVLVPVTKNIRKAVKVADKDLRLGASKISGAYGYNSDNYPNISKIREDRTKQLKNSIVNSVNLYKSIDPKSGRKGKGGASERKQIKKSIDNLKNLIERNRFVKGSLAHLPNNLKDFIRNIDLDGAERKDMLVEDDAIKILDGLGALSARPADAPSDVPDWMFEPITND